MDNRPIVSELVLAVLAACGEALHTHFGRLFGHTRNFQEEFRIAEELERGAVYDLDDQLSAGKPQLGFRHHEISSIFRRRLEKAIDRSSPGIDRHIWAADYDRRIRSLFPTGKQDADRDDGWEGRTRASLTFQHALRRNRGVLRLEKSTTGRFDPSRDDANVFVASPFYIARQILTDPESTSSEATALAAMRVEILRRLKPTFGEIELSHTSVTSALDLIRSRSETSKIARAGADRTDGAILFLCHYLAARGILSMRVSWNPKWSGARVDRMFKSEKNLFSMQGAKGSDTGSRIGFFLHPAFETLPDAGELLNELQGLPIPLEGASTVFLGGVRFATGGDSVIAMSGAYGVGKTSACLSFAAALAPLGCRTLFMSCEEAAEDIANRLEEAIPEHVTRATPLFDCVRLQELRDETGSWFAAHQIRVGEGETGEHGKLNVADEVRSIIDQALGTAALFSPFRQQRELTRRPSFARPIIVVDGLHQLFREAKTDAATVDRSLRILIDRCRQLRALVIFTVGAGEPEMRRLDYLCDFVIELDRRGFSQPNDSTARLFRLLKARHQPARVGAHLFHLTGSKRFRIKPNVASHAEQAKRMRWVEPDSQVRLQLGHQVSIQRYSHVLVFGKGSAGKAGLAMYMLHRSPQLASDEDPAQPLLDLGLESDLRRSARRVAQTEFYEARTLVISFLYQEHYYKNLSRRLPISGGHERQSHLPDRALVDVISLYPGDLAPEDLLAKIENHLLCAEHRGIPYTGVLIDGLHNVFVQFPGIEAAPQLWPQIFNVLRRRQLTVVTTHTEFDLGERSSDPSASLAVDFEHARRRAAPLLTTLVSGADYVFELSAVNLGFRSVEYRLHVRGVLGEDVPAGYGVWDRQRCRLEGWQHRLL